MSNYWQDRRAAAQNKITNKNIRAIERELKRYYSRAMNKVIEEFKNTYNELLATMEDGKEPTPADLYKMDRYWKMQGQLRLELEKLGDKQLSAMSKVFEINFFEIYESIQVTGAKAFTRIDVEAARQLINSIWVADGKSFSQRVWENTQKLIQTLNDGLIECVVTGRKTTELKKQLQERFSVSYSRADTLVRTELAHIQTQAAQQRYKDYGVEQLQFWADADERRCPECGKLHKKLFPANGPMPVPVHPNCRCVMIPVIDDED